MMNGNRADIKYSMNKQENFEDSLYLLMNRIKLIRETLILDADPGLFSEKILEDIDFIDQIVDKLLNWLMENTRLINREELISHLAELEWQFSQILTSILNGSTFIPTLEIAPLKDRITTIRKKSIERQRTTDIISSTVENEPGEPVINSNELYELLKDF
jgi:hypothetical protein